jgi:hypothetical protein
MQTKQTLVSFVVAAVFALPVIASAASSYGSTDEARAAAGARVAPSQSFVSSASAARVTSTDDARAQAGARRVAPMHLACSVAASAATSTDAVRPGLGADVCVRAA